MKRLFCIILTCLVLLSVTVSAFATEITDFVGVWTAEDENTFYIVNIDQEIRPDTTSWRSYYLNFHSFDKKTGEPGSQYSKYEFCYEKDVSKYLAITIGWAGPIVNVVSMNEMGELVLSGRRYTKK